MKQKKARNRHEGSSFASFLDDYGLRQDVESFAIKSVLAWQFSEAMRKKNVTKSKMAEHLRTSRTQIERLLDPSNDAVSLRTLNRAARALGKRVKLDLVDAA
jgi:DNA-binding Xre family transcriptional regulator